MLETHVYIQVSSASPKESEKQYGYVLECEIRGEPRTKEGFGQTIGTFHKATLAAVVEALKRFKQPCKIYIHSENEYVLGSMAGHLGKWAKNDFLNSKGKPVANKEEWQRVWELIQNHEVIPVPGKHSYSEWLLREMKNKENKANDR